MIPKFTFIFSLSPCIIPGNDMHTFRVQAKGNQLNFDTSCQPMHISDKPDSKALCWDSVNSVQLMLATLTPQRAGDEGLHTNRRAVYTRFR